ncbi:MAG: ABC transporter substrate-binding protein [Clostridium sp.]|nr:ABC transporter substrate-binding protein [Clostridium sp.]MCM1547006.1 ABC transporter substrate-binding protein [Ruminococcus sp.]
MKRFVLCILSAVLTLSLVSCKNSENENINFSELQKTGSMELEYAEMFSVDYYENDLAFITIGKDEQYMLVPENGVVPQNIPDSVTVIRQPADNIYLAASSAMDLFSKINALDVVKLTATMEKDWSLPEIKNAMNSGEILYAGKYSAPDYELIIDTGCCLAIESTMIYHSPEIREQLEKMGIPVMVERSSYESHPLGRMEWIKLYGLLTGKQAEADSFFKEKTKAVDTFSEDENTGKTAAFFYITSNGLVNIHKPGDYVSKMIELAGGQNIFTADDLKVEDNSLSTMNVQFESFYDKAKDTDFLIYNSTIDGGISSVDELIGKNSLFADFKAVKNGNVWCTDKNMFQQTTGAADMIYDMHLIFTGNDNGSPSYIYHLE